MELIFFFVIGLQETQSGCSSSAQLSSALNTQVQSEFQLVLIRLTSWMKGVSRTGTKVNRVPFMPLSCSSAGEPTCHHLPSRRQQLSHPRKDGWAQPAIQSSPGLLSCSNCEAMKANMSHCHRRMKTWKVGGIIFDLFDSLFALTKKIRNN